MTKNAVTPLTAAVIVLAVLVFMDSRIRSNPVTYMLLVVLIVLTLTVNNTRQQKSRGAMTKDRINTQISGELSGKEKKFIIFYILNQVGKKEPIEMKDLCMELKVGIYELNDIIRMLSKHGLIEVTYPPLQNFPIIRRGDVEKSRKYMVGIYNELSRRGDTVSESNMEEFAKEVAEYLQTMRT